MYYLPELNITYQVSRVQTFPSLYTQGILHYVKLTTVVYRREFERFVYLLDLVAEIHEGSILIVWRIVVKSQAKQNF